MEISPIENQYDSFQGKLLKTLVWVYKSECSTKLMPDELTDDLGINYKPFLLVLDTNQMVNPSIVMDYLKTDYVALASKELAERVTGQKVGEISPFGHPQKLKTVIDANLLHSDSDNNIFVSVGSGCTQSSVQLRINDLIDSSDAELLAFSTNTTSIEYNFQRHIIKEKLGSLHRSMKSITEKTFRDAALSNDPKILSQMIKYLETVGSIEDIKYLTNAETSISGKTSLHFAAWKGIIQNVRLLIKYGADVNKFSTGMGNYGKTAIFYAITQSRDDMVMELLSQNSIVKIVNNKGQSPRSLASSHLKEETILLIERAELEQSDIEWVNFRATNSDGNTYDDLDPRFNIIEENITINSNSTIRSINPSTYESRKEYRRKYCNLNSNRQISTNEDRIDIINDLFIDYNNDLDNSLYFPDKFPTVDKITGLITIIGVLVSKRRISRSLVFSDIIPVHTFLQSRNKDAELNQSEYFKMKYSWTFDDNSSNDIAQIDVESPKRSIQLIIGKTIRNKFGEAVATNICKNIKVGQLVNVTGTISESKASVINPDNLKTFDIAVSSIHILNASINIGNEFDLKDMFQSENNIDHDFIINIEEEPLNSKEIVVNNTICENVVEDQVEITNDPTNGNVKYLSFQNTDLFKLFNFRDDFIDLNLYTDHDINKGVLLIDDIKSLNLFHQFVIETVENIIKSEQLISTVISIDCEWKPSRQSGEDNPVALMQIAHLNGIFLVDMQTILNSNSVEQINMLDSSLHKLFFHKELIKLGYDIKSDIQNLYSSLPFMSSLQVFKNVVDLNTLSKNLFRNEKNYSPKLITGLSKLANYTLNFSLDKSQQCSAWDNRPLTKEQVILILSLLKCFILIFILD